MRYIHFNILLILCFSFNAFFSFAQQSTSHPLTSYGIGDHQLNDHGIYSGMGNIFTPFLDSGQLNYLNPASYASLSKGNTLYSIGVSQRISFYNQSGDKDVRPNGNLTHIALGFRLKKHFGMAFGLKPLSAKGYYLSEKAFTGLDSIRNTYQGGGYINHVFIGGTYAPIIRKGTYLAFGTHVGYNFGAVKNQRISQLIQGNSASGGIYEELISVSALNIDFGAACYQRIGTKGDVRIGATYKPSLALKSELERSFYSAQNLNAPNGYDTLFSNTYTGSVLQGQSLAFGLAYRIGLNPRKVKTKTLHPEITVAMQYQRSEAFTYAFDGTNYDSLSTQSLSAERVALGIEFKPERFLYENIATLGFFNKFTYRLGAYYGNLPYRDASFNSFKEQGITIGLGVPILAQQAFSSINFSCTLGQQGTFTPNSLQENFVAFQLNAILSPASFERWFRKRKMD
ncbi:MAG: hypothetical protein ACKO4Y_00390 [Flavobacteriales bacterium]